MLATRSCRVQSDRHIFPRDQLCLKFVAPQALVRANNSRESSLLFTFMHPTSMAAGELDIVMEEAAAMLGYHSLKEEQMKAVKFFFKGWTCLSLFQQDMASRYITRYCHLFTTNGERRWKGGRL